MAESMSSPWIRDYFINVAETYGAQLYNAPMSSGKKKVQVTDFLTYQENSYVWAWISDKDHKVSVRISPDAAGTYKSSYSRNIIDCRFSVVIISNYRPMFSPRPLGPNVTGNTPVSHISLEIGHIKLLGIGGHLFGNPRDLELHENVKEWVHGLRQDGGGGNVLKLRKQELAQNKKAELSPPSPPPFSLYAPVSRCLAIKAPEHIAKPNFEQSQDLKRAYAKRWRIIEANSWKFATRPVVEEPPNLYPTPHRTPLPTSRVQRQGTPTDWSPSIIGSSVAQGKATTVSLDEIRPHDESEVLPTTLHVPSDTDDHGTTEAVVASDTRSLQPPAPAQRIKRLLSPRPASPSRTSPEIHVRSSLPSQQLPGSSLPPPSSSLPPPSSSLPIPVGIRKDIQRKVHRPELPVTRPDPVKQGPAQILVLNSDTSRAGSSQSYSQSQHLPWSQESQRQLASRPPAFPSSLATDFQPPHASTPTEGKHGSLTRRASKSFVETLVAHREQDTEKFGVNARNQEESDSTWPPAPSAPKMEVLEIGTSDTEEEADQLQLTRNTAQMSTGFDSQTGSQDIDSDAEGVAADDEGNHASVDEVEVQSAPQLETGPSRQATESPATTVVQRLSPDEHIPRLPEVPGSRSSMRPLFSDSSEDERLVSSLASMLPVGQKEENVQEKANPVHDPEAWKEPSFLGRKRTKGKARATEEADIGTPSGEASKKRWRSAQAESPVRKRAKAAGPKVHQVVSGKIGTSKTTQSQDIEAPAIGKVPPNDRPSASATETTEMTTPSIPVQSFKPRLVNFVVDFEKIDLGKGVSIPRVDVNKDMKHILLRTGRVRKLGDEVVSDGSVYIKT